MDYRIWLNFGNELVCDKLIAQIQLAPMRALGIMSAVQIQCGGENLALAAINLPQSTAQPSANKTIATGN